MPAGAEAKGSAFSPSSQGKIAAREPSKASTPYHTISSRRKKLGKNFMWLRSCAGRCLGVLMPAFCTSEEGLCLYAAASLDSALGEKQKALVYLGQALALFRAVGDLSGEAAALNDIGRVYLDLGEKQKALDQYGQALPLFRAVGDRHGEAGVLNR